MVTRIPERLVPLALLAVLTAGTTLSGQSLPASEETARARLNASPRHGEWVKVESGGDTINAWVVYPERSDRHPLSWLFTRSTALPIGFAPWPIN